MAKNIINLEDFAEMLKTYRSTLLEMNQLTENEIERVSSIGISFDPESQDSGKEAAKFVNKQMYSFLDKLSALVTTIPDYTVHGCFTTQEMKLIQEKALNKLKELGYNA